MPPNSDDSGKIRRLRVVPDLPLASGEPAEAAPESGEPRPPADSVDPQNLARLREGRLPSEYFRSIQAVLPALAIPDARGGFEVTISSDRIRYVVRRSDGSAPFEVTVNQRSGPGFSEALRMTYLPDGRLSSSLHPEPHADWLRGLEKSHHSAFTRLLSASSENLIFGAAWQRRMRAVLGNLEGRYEPESRSTWYEHFIADKGTIYSFALQNAPDIGEAMPERFPLLRVFADTVTASGAERRHILDLAPNGETSFDPNRTLRSAPTAVELAMVKQFETTLTEAVENPQAYQIALSRAMARIPGGETIHVPTIAPATRALANAGSSFGSMGEPILEIHRISDLIRNFHPLAGHRWQNPKDASEVRNLRPSYRLSRIMGGELLRWIFSGPYHYLFNALNEPRKVGNYLRLQLYPNGGGELSIYRDGAIHDIISQTGDGRLWRASDVIEAMQLRGTNFESRFEALQAAITQRNSGSDVRSPLTVQQAPPIDLDRFHLNAEGHPEAIRDFETAWRLIQAQIPPGTEVRIVPELNALGRRRGVQVDFFHSNPSTTLKIRHVEVPSGAGGGTVPRVTLFLDRGTEHCSMVFEDGKLRPDLTAPDLNRTPDTVGATRRPSALRRAAALPHFYFVRRPFWALSDGIPFVLGHFASTFIVRAVEGAMFTPAERRLIGTPAPQFTPHYVWDTFTAYGKMALFAGIGSVMTDGVYNSLISRTSRARALASVESIAFRQAWAKTPGGIFNGNAFARPVRTNFGFRVVQRAVPLIAGLVGPEIWDHHTVDFSRLRNNLMYIGLATATTTAITHLVTRSTTMSRAAVRTGFLRTAEIGTHGARFATRMRANILLAAVEFTIIGIMQARDRREAMGEVRSGLRSQLGDAIDRRNELITRLERGEPVTPRELMEADTSFQQTQAAYRRFLELDERLTGSGSFESIGMENDFLDEYERYDRSSALSSAGAMSTDLSLGIAGHQSRLDDLRRRRSSMELELAAMHARFGVANEPISAPEISLAEWVQQLAAAQDEGSATATPTLAVASPIAVDSPAAEAILEQFRWKAAHEPEFVLWSPERRARYILREFRGYRASESDGTTRPWTLDEGLAFLSAVDQAEATRAANFEQPLTLPREGERFNTTRLQNLFAEDRAIRERERVAHTHSRIHASRIAENVADFDRQMEDYLSRTNQATDAALSRYLEPQDVVASL